MNVAFEDLMISDPDFPAFAHIGKSAGYSEQSLAAHWNNRIPTAEHSHKCGWTALGQLPQGCGHVWTHKTVREYIPEDHFCPKCGFGPMTLRI